MKLLTKTTRTYLFYAALLLLAAIPVSYFFIKNIVQEDVDEGLQAQKHAILQQLDSANLESFKQFPSLNTQLKESGARTVTERTYTTTLFDSIAEELVPYRVLLSPVQINQRNYELELRTSLVDKNDLVIALTLIQVVLLLFLLTGLAVLNRRLSKQIWIPFYQLINRLRGYEIQKNETLKFPPAAIDEFRDLQDSVTTLTNRASASYRQQRQFTENASHELQTPLAIMQGQLDLLMQTEPIQPRQAELIESMDEALRRLQQLNKSLLLLTRINNQRFPENESIKLADQLLKLIERYRPMLEEKSLNLNSTINSFLTVECNNALLDTLISNLLLNSIRHNSLNGGIRIELTGSQLVVENSGTASSLHWTKEKQIQQKTASGQEGLGLGLEIVRSICYLYNWQINYQFEDSKHRFILDFAERDHEV